MLSTTSFLEALWYDGKHPLNWILLPVAVVYRMVIKIRRYGYEHGWWSSTRLPVVVIIIGNITVGGAGKTPVVVWVASFLADYGWRPGIISRGYGGRITEIPREVRPTDDPRVVGDEPVLLAQRTGVPVVVGKWRAQAGKLLLARHDCDCIIADDGLQHYALARDVEIVVTDRVRGLGNGHCLPAGPLREPVARLAQIPLRIAHGPPEPGEYAMTLVPGDAILVADGITTRPLAALRSTAVHAIAGIGYPARFFTMLQNAGLMVISHTFPDHHYFRPEELVFDDDLPVLMTEKDAVKCMAFAQPKYWYVPVTAQLAPEFGIQLLQCIGTNKNTIG